MIGASSRTTISTTIAVSGINTLGSSRGACSHNFFSISDYGILCSSTFSFSATYLPAAGFGRFGGCVGAAVSAYSEKKEVDEKS